MRQAQTLNEAQLRRVIHYCRSRRHPIRDETIILVSFYAGLRAKEIAALTVGNIFDEDGAVRTQFILSAQQSKGGQTRTVYLNQRLRKALRENMVIIYASQIHSVRCLPVKRAVTSRPTQCASCFWTYTKQLGSRTPQVIQAAGRTLPVWQTRELVYACWQRLPDIPIYPRHRGT